MMPCCWVVLEFHLFKANTFADKWPVRFNPQKQLNKLILTGLPMKVMDAGRLALDSGQLDG